MDSCGQEKNASPCGNLSAVIALTALYRFSQCIAPDGKAHVPKDRHSSDGIAEEIKIMIDFQRAYAFSKALCATPSIRSAL